MRLGVVGAGNFARFATSATAELDEVEITAVTDADPHRAADLAAVFGARVLPTVNALLGNNAVDGVLIATPPHSHASLSVRALTAGKHVLCEKPAALSEADIVAVETALRGTSLTYVIDHVLRYNPILAALRRLRDDRLLGPTRQFCFENDATDEDLPPDHWFWDEAISGGILLEHGVHFFDAAALLVDAPATHAQSVASRRPDGRIDTVRCTCIHANGALASHAHAFTHPRRAERQFMRLDCGLAEVQVYGWIPIRAELDIWADDPTAAALEELPSRASELLRVDGFRPSGAEQITVRCCRNAAPPRARTHDMDLEAPHHLTLTIDIGGAAAKSRVYQESIRSAFHDLARCAHTNDRPTAGIDSATAATQTAIAASRALRDGCLREVAPTSPTASADSARRPNR